MAWYTLTYQCGCEGRVQLCGPNRSRQSRLKWLEDNHICPECFEKQRAREREEALAKSKKEGEEAIKILKEKNSNLPPLTGTEKQVPWAEQIRARFLCDNDIAWAVEIQMKKNPELALNAKYWIDNRIREPINWARRALPPNWNEIPIPSPMAKYASKIIRLVIGHHDSLADTISSLSEYATISIVDEKRPSVDSSSYFCSTNAIEVDHWLIAHWTRTGLIEWFKGRIEEASRIAAPVLDAAKVAQKIAADKKMIEEAEDIAQTVESKIRQAKQKQTLAAHLEEQADASLEAAALRLGVQGLIDNVIWISKEILDDGNRVHCCDPSGAVWKTFSKDDFIAGVQALAMYYQHGGR
jgi:hypothetical protein